jgi:hypothetical protein
LIGARERRLEDVAATFDHGYSDYVSSWSRVYYGGCSSRTMEFYPKLREEATRRSELKSEAALKIKAL